MNISKVSPFFTRTYAINLLAPELLVAWAYLGIFLSLVMVQRVNETLMKANEKLSLV